MGKRNSLVKNICPKGRESYHKLIRGDCSKILVVRNKSYGCLGLMCGRSAVRDFRNHSFLERGSLLPCFCVLFCLCFSSHPISCDLNFLFFFSSDFLCGFSCFINFNSRESSLFLFFTIYYFFTNVLQIKTKFRINNC